MAGFLAARSRHWRGHLFTFFERNRRAIPAFERAPAPDPRMLDAQQCVGFPHAHERQRAKAVAALKEAVRLAPDNADTRSNLGSIHCGRRGFDDAIAQRTEAIGVEPVIARAWHGLIHLDRGDSPAAIEHRQQAAKQQYFNARAGDQLAIASHRAGAPEKAVAEQKRVESFDPKTGAQIAHDMGMR
jgi:tetratricopeptide (TPR) repeat protein